MNERASGREGDASDRLHEQSKGGVQALPKLDA
jgi:hypothetical protein